MTERNVDSTDDTAQMKDRSVKPSDNQGGHFKLITPSNQHGKQTHRGMERHATHASMLRSESATAGDPQNRVT